MHRNLLRANTAIEQDSDAIDGIFFPGHDLICSHKRINRVHEIIPSANILAENLNWLVEQLSKRTETIDWDLFAIFRQGLEPDSPAPSAR